MRFINRQTIAAFLLGSALVAGAGAFAVDHRMGMQAMHAGDPAAHADHVLKHLYAELDASENQKAKIDPLVKQAMQDLQPLHQQLHAAHSKALQTLTETGMDRAAMEASRLQLMQLADQASKRVVQLIADVGEVLTPAQRQKLAEHLGKMHGAMRHPG
ncbi:MAG: Spy/CpxP family protein refolding chaperone [Sphingomonadaceae bacterium]